MWICPECDAEIEKLCYDVSTNSSEYGTAYLTDEKKESRRDIVTDHESEDGGDTEWSDDPNYRCPECDNDIDPVNLIWKNDDEDEDEDDDKPKPEPEPEETLHKIIVPKKNIMKTDLPKSTEDSSIICKNKKCLHVFIINTSRGGYYNNTDEGETFDCPRCSTSNTLEEYKELLASGYF
jgi:hypothetical protein